MREFGVVVLVVGGIGAIVTLVTWQTAGGTRLPSFISQAPPIAAAQPAKEEVKQLEKPKPSRKPRATAKPPEAVEIAHATAPAAPELITATMPAKKLPVPFPNAEDLKPGMHRSRIRAMYGEPSYVTIQSSNGRLQERYVYLNRDRNVATVVLLANGSIERTSSLPD